MVIEFWTHAMERRIRGRSIYLGTSNKRICVSTAARVDASSILVPSCHVFIVVIVDRRI